ncbi:2-oxoadipate dioxygenase/decarboxylase family protein [Naumannella halotolerans]|uniref:2-oxoadipate dioxygenase/decarboxylase n=1 Tax=Naumannella halotolerans TaxID=993414 RepID=UPI00370D6180
MSFVPAWELRAAFARALSGMYGTEVPAYTTLVEVSLGVNTDVAAGAEDAERLGSIARVTAERHGAIRVGSPAEMAQVARVFGAFGMYAVGFYDLRDAAKSSVPVVSTAFRPTEAEELARNPFRVFTSMLATDDRRFFDPELSAEINRFVDARELFGAELLELADAAIAAGGLDSGDAERLLELATAAFELSAEPVDHDWYRRLEKISAVAADIAGIGSTHINHLTPRVLDIDQLYDRMEQRGITMIDEIQGPPRWHGPDVLLRQTSFRALDEERTFRFADGTVGPGSLRVRFGEVEARGIALTPAGRDHYDALLSEVDRRLAADPDGPAKASVTDQPDIRALSTPRQLTARQVWTEAMPATEQALDEAGMGWFSYAVAQDAPHLDAPQGGEGTRRSLSELVHAGLLERRPIVYEDFLPRSAAGIFQSNLAAEGERDATRDAEAYDLHRLSELIGAPIADPHELYRAERAASLQQAAERLGIEITE